MNDNSYELYHYGVLGMKWGVRRAQKKGTTYKYESFRTKAAKKIAVGMSDRAKKLKDKSEKYASEGENKKAKKYADKAAVKQKEALTQKKWANASAKHDAGIQKIAESMSTGKAVAQTLLTGGWNKTYHSIRVSGEGSISKGKAAAMTFLGGTYAETAYLERYLTRNS